ncbi:MAG: hypothetical protein ACRC1P_09455 [Cellulosilyticaceae bacterium]
MSKLTINHLPIGSKVFYLKQEDSKRICDKCNGTKELIISVKDEVKKVKCAYCGKDGTVYAGGKEYVVANGNIHMVTAHLKSDSLETSYTLKNTSELTFFKSPDELYLTRKAAQRAINILNGTHTTMNIDDIKIHESMKKTPPKLNKLMSRDAYYKTHGEFCKPVHINSDGYIVDGYITYLLCKIHDIEEVPVLLLGGDKDE